MQEVAVEVVRVRTQFAAFHQTNIEVSGEGVRAGVIGTHDRGSQSRKEDNRGTHDELIRDAVYRKKRRQDERSWREKRERGGENKE